jgi:uncharacterized protein YndB with AHSA1/START domain
MQDRIEQEITVKAPIDRVWAAITDHLEFGRWFRASLHGPFVVGQVTKGTLSEPGHEGTPFWANVVALEAPHRFAFDWPSEADMTPDMTGPGLTTRVEFLLQTVPEGTRIVISESGFAALPKALGERMSRENAGGWAIQAERIKAHVRG